MTTDYTFITGSGSVTAAETDAKSYKDYEIVGSQATGHMTDGAAAVYAWVQRTLKTRQFVYPVYSWDHGVDFDQFVGDNYTPELIDAEVTRNITEALMRHPSIAAVSDFVISSSGDDLSVTCRVTTIWGESFDAVY